MRGCSVLPLAAHHERRSSPFARLVRNFRLRPLAGAVAWAGSADDPAQSQLSDRPRPGNLLRDRPGTAGRSAALSRPLGQQAARHLLPLRGHCEDIRPGHVEHWPAGYSLAAGHFRLYLPLYGTDPRQGRGVPRRPGERRAAHPRRLLGRGPAGNLPHAFRLRQLLSAPRPSDERQGVAGRNSLCRRILG